MTPKKGEKIVEVSQIEYHRPLWRYAVLFQSWSQFESWLIMFVLASFTVYGFLLATSQPIKSLEVVLVAVAIGSLVAVAMTLPAQFTVSATEAAPLRALTMELENMRYHERLHWENIVTYHQKLPRLLRWNEGEVTIQRHEKTATITGPQFILTILRGKLLRQYA